MATFESKVYQLTVTEHPNADRLEIARVGDYLCVIGKDSFKTGDWAAYVPEGSIVPDNIVLELGLEGKLAGKDKNRVKAVKLRGVLSQGLVYPLDGIRLKELAVEPGDDVTEALGLIKHEPPIPVSMSGQVSSVLGYSIVYDIENIKKYPHTFEDGEIVSVTEKIHGTWCCLGWHCAVGRVITSKGLSARGLALDPNVSKNRNNLYVMAVYDYRESLERLWRTVRIDKNCKDFAHYGFYVLGEIFGKGIQDYHYGVKQGTFRVFDIYIGTPGSGQGRYLNVKEVRNFLNACSGYEKVDESSLEYVPVIWDGAYDREKINKLTAGVAVVSALETGKAVDHGREGIVVRPMIERRNSDIGRIILKSVSDDYLLRKGGTEFE